MDFRKIRLRYENVNWLAEDRAQGLVVIKTKFQIAKPNDFRTVQPTYIPYVWDIDSCSAEIVTNS